jgi:hypothetical protein
MKEKVSAFQIKLNSILRKLGHSRDPEFIPVFFFARSGSTVHGATLNTHTNCVSLNEAFEHYTDAEGVPYLKINQPKKVEAYFEHFKNNRLPLTREHFLSIVKQHRDYIRAKKGKYLTHCFIQFNEFYFPIFQDKLDFDAFFSFIGREFPGMIFISRKNSLAQSVSVKRAREFEIWHSSTLKKNQDLKESIYYNPNGPYTSHLVTGNSLVEFLENKQSSEKAILETAQKYNKRLLHLTYEDDIEPDVTIGVNKVINFFDIPESAKPLKVPLQKTSFGLKNDISNYDEISALLKGTSVEWMLT